jgi:phosphoserine phosphatase
MSGRDKIVCLFDVDGTLTAPMKASLIFLLGEGAVWYALNVLQKLNNWE